MGSSLISSMVFIMPCTTFLHTNETTNVTDKDLRELLNESLYISQNYIVKERSWIEKKWFKKDIKHTYYDVYFKLPAPNGGWIGDAQCISFSGGPKYDQVYAYFLGILTGLDVTEEEYRKGSLERRMYSENQGIVFLND